MCVYVNVCKSGNIYITHTYNFMQVFHSVLDTNSSKNMVPSLQCILVWELDFDQTITHIMQYKCGNCYEGEEHDAM